MIPATIRVYQSPSVCSEIANTVEELERHAAAGYFPLPEDRHLAAIFVPPAPTLSQDGPTLKQYVAAGYSADSYPPVGFAARVDEAADARLEVELKAKADSAKPTESSTATPPEGAPADASVPPAITTPPDGAVPDSGSKPAAETPKSGGKNSARG